MYQDVLWGFYRNCSPCTSIFLWFGSIKKRRDQGYGGFPTCYLIEKYFYIRTQLLFCETYRKPFGNFYPTKRKLFSNMLYSVLYYFFVKFWWWSTKLIPQIIYVTNYNLKILMQNILDLILRSMPFNKVITLYCANKCLFFHLHYARMWIMIPILHKRKIMLAWMGSEGYWMT
jgi:hypothetical protein